MAISFTDCRAVIVQETFKIFAYYKSIHYLFGEMYDFKLIITKFLNYDHHIIIYCS